MFVSYSTTFSLLFTVHWTLPIAFQTSIGQDSNKLYQSETFFKNTALFNILYKTYQDMQEKRTVYEIAAVQK